MKKMYLVSATLLLSVFSDFSYQNPNTKNKLLTQDEIEQIMYNWSRTFAEVLQLAKQKHYKITNLEQGMIKSIDAFLNQLDPHSSFLDPKTYKLMMEATSGEFFGIGIVIDNTRKPKDKYLTIVDTMPGGPSDTAGIKPFDKIIEIDGKPLEGMPTEEATSLLKGERNSKVHIKILREKEKDLLSFDIIRDVIKEQHSMSFFLKDHNIHYLSLNMFSEIAVRQIEQLLKKANENNYKALILDLRNNSGGLLVAAIEIAGLFLPKGSLIVATKDNTNKETEKFYTKKNPVTNGATPIFILMNNYTASAAEILAGALRMHSEQQAKANKKNPLCVFLVGTKTFGKGSVQEVIPVSNNSAVKLTTSLYFLPNDTTIQGVGIKPDFFIEHCLPPTEQMEWFTKYYGREQTLTNYIQADNHVDEKDESSNKKKEPSRWLDRAKDMLQTDNQLREAISLANLFGTFKQLCPDKMCSVTSAIALLKENHLTNEQLAIEEVKL